MAAQRHGISLRVLLLALLAGIPCLYLLQAVVRHVRSPDARLAVELEVEVNDASPTRFLAELAPTGPGSHLEGGLALTGGGRHRLTGFPWREAPFEGLLHLEVATAALAPGADLRTEDGALWASYRERYLESEQDGGFEPATCTGKLHVDRLRTRGARTAPTGEAFWTRIRRFQGRLDLTCAQAEGGTSRRGPSTSVTWSLRGPFRLRWTRSPR